jgi:hypothetical protein
MSKEDKVDENTHDLGKNLMEETVEQRNARNNRTTIVVTVHHGILVLTILWPYTSAISSILRRIISMN